MDWWNRFKVFVREVVVETKKVTWPSKDEVLATTVVVIAASFVFGVFLYLCDLLFLNAVKWVIGALS